MSYGWRVVGGGFLSQAFVIGFFTYAVSLLTQPVRETFDVGVEMVMYSLTCGTFVGLFTMPIVGVLLDKLSVRKLFAAGIVLFAFGLWLLGQSTTIVQYIVIFGITMALANALAGSMISSAVVSRWFTDNRGKALGVAATGTSVGGILIPGLITYWLPEYGWRGTLENLAIVLVVLVLPVVVWAIRSWPPEVGLQAAQEGQGTGSATSAAQLGLKDILRNPSFWWLGAALGLLFSTYTSILSNLTPYATQLGHQEEAASGLIMVVAISGLLGKLDIWRGRRQDRSKIGAVECATARSRRLRHTCNGTFLPPDYVGLRLDRVGGGRDVTRVGRLYRGYFWPAKLRACLRADGANHNPVCYGGVSPDW